MSALAFVDTETTGLYPERGAECWEIALVIRPGEGESAGEDDEYCWQVRPSLMLADPVALGAGGYYERCQVDHLERGAALLTSSSRGKGPQTTAAVVASDIARLLAGVTLSGHNIPFDAGHLGHFLRANGQCGAWDYHLLDTGTLVRGWAHGRGMAVPAGPLKLRAALELAGLHPAAYRLHEALEDARACRDISDVVTGRRS